MVLPNLQQAYHNLGQSWIPYSFEEQGRRPEIPLALSGRVSAWISSIDNWLGE